MEKDVKLVGFWLYLMTDLIIFSVLFACYIVLSPNIFTGPSGKELFSLPLALSETLVLLTSSFTCAIGMFFVYQKKKLGAIIAFFITILLGATFLFLEISEFHEFVKTGVSWRKSAFLSSYFTLVGTHGLHITIGLIWMLIMILQICFRPLIDTHISRIFRMALFWHFLDFVWIFIFTTVYGMGYI